MTAILIRAQFAHKDPQRVLMEKGKKKKQRRGHVTNKQRLK